MESDDLSGVSRSEPPANMQCDDLDLYDDIIVEEDNLEKETYTEVLKKFEAAMATITKLETENTTLTSSVNQLKAVSETAQKNLSSVLLTARAEMERKNAEISRLRKQLKPNTPFSRYQNKRLRDVNTSSASSEPESANASDNKSTSNKIPFSRRSFLRNRSPGHSRSDSEKGESNETEKSCHSNSFKDRTDRLRDGDKRTDRLRDGDRQCDRYSDSEDKKGIAIGEKQSHSKCDNDVVKKQERNVEKCNDVRRTRASERFEHSKSDKEDAESGRGRKSQALNSSRDETDKATSKTEDKQLLRSHRKCDRQKSPEKHYGKRNEKHLDDSEKNSRHKSKDMCKERSPSKKEHRISESSSISNERNSEKYKEKYSDRTKRNEGLERSCSKDTKTDKKSRNISRSKERECEKHKEELSDKIKRNEDAEKACLKDTESGKKSWSSSTSIDRKSEKYKEEQSDKLKRNEGLERKNKDERSEKRVTERVHRNEGDIRHGVYDLRQKLKSKQKKTETVQEKVELSQTEVETTQKEKEKTHKKLDSEMDLNSQKHGRDHRADADKEETVRETAKKSTHGTYRKTHVDTSVELEKDRLFLTQLLRSTQDKERHNLETKTVTDTDNKNKENVVCDRKLDNKNKETVNIAKPARDLVDYYDIENEVDFHTNEMDTSEKIREGDSLRNKNGQKCNNSIEENDAVSVSVSSDLYTCDSQTNSNRQINHNKDSKLTDVCEPNKQKRESIDANFLYANIGEDMELLNESINVDDSFDKEIFAVGQNGNQRDGEEIAKGGNKDDNEVKKNVVAAVGVKQHGGSDISECVQTHAKDHQISNTPISINADEQPVISPEQSKDYASMNEVVNKLVNIDVTKAERLNKDTDTLMNNGQKSVACDSNSQKYEKGTSSEEKQTTKGRRKSRESDCQKPYRCVISETISSVTSCDLTYVENEINDSSKQNLSPNKVCGKLNCRMKVNHLHPKVSPNTSPQKGKNLDIPLDRESLTDPCKTNNALNGEETPKVAHDVAFGNKVSKDLPLEDVQQDRTIITGASEVQNQKEDGVTESLSQNSSSSGSFGSNILTEQTKSPASLYTSDSSESTGSEYTETESESSVDSGNEDPSFDNFAVTNESVKCGHEKDEVAEKKIQKVVYSSNMQTKSADMETDIDNSAPKATAGSDTCQSFKKSKETEHNENTEASSKKSNTPEQKKKTSSLLNELPTVLTQSPDKSFLLQSLLCGVETLMETKQSEEAEKHSKADSNTRDSASDRVNQNMSGAESHSSRKVSEVELFGAPLSLTTDSSASSSYSDSEYESDSDSSNESSSSSCSTCSTCSGSSSFTSFSDTSTDGSFDSDTEDELVKVDGTSKRRDSTDKQTDGMDDVKSEEKQSDCCVNVDIEDKQSGNDKVDGEKKQTENNVSSENKNTDMVEKEKQIGIVDVDKDKKVDIVETVERKEDVERKTIENLNNLLQDKSVNVSSAEMEIGSPRKEPENVLTAKQISPCVLKISRNTSISPPTNTETCTTENLSKLNRPNAITNENIDESITEEKAFTEKEPKSKQHFTQPKSNSHKQHEKNKSNDKLQVKNSEKESAKLASRKPCKTSRTLGGKPCKTSRTVGVKSNGKSTGITKIKDKEKTEEMRKFEKEATSCDTIMAEKVNKRKEPTECVFPVKVQSFINKQSAKSNTAVGRQLHTGNDKINATEEQPNEGDRKTKPCKSSSVKNHSNSRTAVQKSDGKVNNSKESKVSMRSTVVARPSMSKTDSIKKINSSHYSEGVDKSCEIVSNLRAEKERSKGKLESGKENLSRCEPDQEKANLASVDKTSLVPVTGNRRETETKHQGSQNTANSVSVKTLRISPERALREVTSFHLESYKIPKRKAECVQLNSMKKNKESKDLSRKSVLDLRIDEKKSLRSQRNRQEQPSKSRYSQKQNKKDLHDSKTSRSSEPLKSDATARQKQNKKDLHDSKTLRSSDPLKSDVTARQKQNKKDLHDSKTLRSSEPLKSDVTAHVTQFTSNKINLRKDRQKKVLSKEFLSSSESETQSDTTSGDESSLNSESGERIVEAIFGKSSSSTESEQSMKHTDLCRTRNGESTERSVRDLDAASDILEKKAVTRKRVRKISSDTDSDDIQIGKNKSNKEICKNDSENNGLGNEFVSPRTNALQQASKLVTEMIENKQEKQKTKKTTLPGSNGNHNSVELSESVQENGTVNKSEKNHTQVIEKKQAHRSENVSKSDASKFSQSKDRPVLSCALDVNTSKEKETNAGKKLKAKGDKKNCSPNRDTDRHVSQDLEVVGKNDKSVTIAAEAKLSPTETENKKEMNAQVVLSLEIHSEETELDFIDCNEEMSFGEGDVDFCRESESDSSSSSGTSTSSEDGEISDDSETEPIQFKRSPTKPFKLFQENPASPEMLKIKNKLNFSALRSSKFSPIKFPTSSGVGKKALDLGDARPSTRTDKRKYRSDSNSDTDTSFPSKHGHRPLSYSSSKRDSSAQRRMSSCSGEKAKHEALTSKRNKRYESPKHVTKRRSRSCSPRPRRRERSTERCSKRDKSERKSEYDQSRRRKDTDLNSSRKPQSSSRDSGSDDGRRKRDRFSARISGNRYKRDRQSSNSSHYDSCSESRIKKSRSKDRHRSPTSNKSICERSGKEAGSRSIGGEKESCRGRDNLRPRQKVKNGNENRDVNKRRYDEPRGRKKPEKQMSKDISPKKTQTRDSRSCKKTHEKGHNSSSDIEELLSKRKGHKRKHFRSSTDYETDSEHSCLETSSTPVVKKVRKDA